LDSAFDDDSTTYEDGERLISEIERQRDLVESLENVLNWPGDSSESEDGKEPTTDKGECVDLASSPVMNTTQVPPSLFEDRLAQDKSTKQSSIGSGWKSNASSLFDDKKGYMRANTPVEVGRKVDAENEKKMKKERKLEQQRQSAEIDESRVKYHAALNEPKYGEAPTERLNNANLVRVLKGEAASSHDAPLIPLAANVDLALDLQKQLTALSKDQRGVFIRVILRQPDKRKKVSGGRLTHRHGLRRPPRLDSQSDQRAIRRASTQRRHVHCGPGEAREAREARGGSSAFSALHAPGRPASRV
jgi:hypothetical protein